MFIFWGRPNSISDLQSAVKPFESSMRSMVNIAIIDDEDFPYLDLLQTHDFHIRKIPDVSDIKALNTYDIIFCDVRGVGRELSKKFEGAYLIKEIRKAYPNKVVYAYTGQSYDASFSKYFDYADQVIKKDISSEEWVETLDRAVEIALNPVIQWRRLRKRLLRDNVELKAIVYLEDEFVQSFLAKANKFPSKRSLSFLNDDARSVLQSFVASALFKLFIG